MLPERVIVLVLFLVFRAKVFLTFHILTFHILNYKSLYIMEGKNKMEYYGIENGSTRINK
jgi:hypothetical protein